MRRALAVVGLIGLGVLLGFVIRLVWPRHDRLTLDSYSPMDGHGAGVEDAPTRAEASRSA